MLDSRETKVFVKLATPLATEDSTLRIAWAVLTRIKLSLVLWIDMVTHVSAIVNGEEDGLEGALTIGAFLFSNFFTFPLVAISVAESLCFNASLMIIGLYDLKRYLDRGNNDKKLREFVKPYVNGEEALTLRTLQSVFCMKANSVLDESLNFRREIMGTLPLLIFKVYFAYMEDSHCSYTSILRFGVILFGLYEPIKTCVAQEASFVEMLQAGNLFDVGLISKSTSSFSHKISSKFTEVFAIVSTTVSMVYRVYAILLYTVIHPLTGFFQLLLALAISTLLHCTLRPVYENPPIAASSLSYNIVETISKLFLIRCKRIYGSYMLAKLWFSWTSLLIFEHCVSLYLIHALVNGAIEGGISDLGSCPAWIQRLTQWFMGLVNPSLVLSGSGSIEEILLNSPFFTGLLALNILVNSINLAYLGCSHLNDAQFPAIAGHGIWSNRFFKRIFKWRDNSGRNQPNSLQIEWLIKMMVLTLLSEEEFKIYLPRWTVCSGTKTALNWRDLALKKAGELPAPSFERIVARIQNEQAMSDELVEFVQYVYSVDTESVTLRKLANLFSANFDSVMTSMTSHRITITCNLLGVNPATKSPFKL